MDIVRLEYWNMDNVHWVHGQCPLSPWMMSTQSMDIVHSPWTMSTETVDNVHWIDGHYPLSPWTFFLGFPYTLFSKNYSSPTKLNRYIQFTMHVIYISCHTMPICPSILSLGPLPFSRSHKNKLHCYIYCAVVSLFTVPPVDAATCIKHAPILNGHFTFPQMIAHVNAPLLSKHLANAASGQRILSKIGP